MRLSGTAKGVPFRSVPIYSVTGLKPGQSLMMYVEKGEQSAIAVEIPHNATWVTKMGKVAKGGNVAFELVRWAGQNGWVNAAYLKEDPVKTKEGDEKRRRCSGGKELLPAAASDVVCLPAAVIRRLRNPVPCLMSTASTGPTALQEVQLRLLINLIGSRIEKYYR
ncbi:MAG: hypothetical protein R3E89_06105 [Thiolinea sp.]